MKNDRTSIFTKRPLLLTGLALFAAACAAPQQVARSPEPVSWAGPAGPTGAVGATGSTGAQGSTGYTGARGQTELAGMSGPRGASGASGPQGAAGTSGAQGPLASGGTWSVYRNYDFTNGNQIARSDGRKAREVAEYSNQNPSYRLAIDGHDERRVSAVRTALIDAGVPASRIETGTYGDPKARKDSQVAVLVSR